MLFDSAGISSARAADEYHPQTGYETSEDEVEPENAFQSQPVPIGHGPSTHVTITPKIPPHYNGLTSWFNYEELIDDWVDITTLDEDKRGPALRNRLIGAAEPLRKYLDQDKEALKSERGIQYFKDTLRPFFVKGVHNVYIWRFFRFLSFRRGARDMLDWVSRIGIEYMRLKESWMDLLHQPTFESQEWLAFVAEENITRAAHNDRVNWLLQAQVAMNAQLQDPRIP